MLVVFFVMSLIGLLVLDWIGAIKFEGGGTIFGIKWKAAGGAAFLVVFIVVLVFLLGKIKTTAVALTDFARTMRLPH